MDSTIRFGDANSGFQAGIINGQVKTEFHQHAPPERVETPPSPSIVIPFSRDTDFVERGTILEEISQKCAVLGSRTALVGLGGVGKSQLAIEFAYRARELSPETWVFWVHASNAARFEQSLRDIANYLKLPGRENTKANIFQLVHDWLRDSRKGKWILILDNVDNVSFLVDSGKASQEGQISNTSTQTLRPLMTYLPQCSNGSILITTRSNGAALELVESRDIIPVEPMGREDALGLLGKKLGCHDNSEDAAELAETLEFMPLAIVQAAAYITQNMPRYSVQKYLQDFRKSDRKKTNLLDFEGGKLRRDWEAKNSIITTWQISFDHLQEIRPSATELLSLMSFFDRQGIPETLLRSRSEPTMSLEEKKQSSEIDDINIDNDDTDYNDENEDDISQSSVGDDFEDDISALRNYSFISINTDCTSFEMHRLVQLATRKWLQAHGQQEKWKQLFIKNLDAELPTGDHENWAKCRVLFPHAKSAAAQKPEKQDFLIGWASILHKAAWYAMRMGNGSESEEMSLQALRIRKKMLGREHNDTLNSMALVGLAYQLRGRWDNAKDLELQVMETRKRVLGQEHPDTLSSIANLASTYRNQGRWKEAEGLNLKVMETRKRVLGQEHPNTLSSIGNLASTYWNQGRWKEAESLELQVMETRKRVLGQEHPDTLHSMNNLAYTWQKSGRDTEAIRLMEDCVRLRNTVLGSNHPDTLSSCNNLAEWKSDSLQRPLPQLLQ